MLPGYFPYAVYVVVAGTPVVFYHYYIRECLRFIHEFWRERFLWHIADKSQHKAIRVSTLASYRKLCFFPYSVNPVA